MKKQQYKNLEDIVPKLKQASNCSAIAYFNSDGKLIEANKSMSSFLGTSPDKLQPTNFLINPDFEKLKRLSSKNKLIFEGLLTIGNFRDISYVLNSKIFKKDGIYLIYAEADVLNLFEENSKMSRLNQEVNNLQRKLLKEKTKLEKTLKKLNETQQMLIHSEKMNALGQMVAGIAHEINNPIAFVTNNLYELNKYTNEIFEAFTDLDNKFLALKNENALAVIKEIKNKYDFDYLTEDVTEVIKESQMGVERVKTIVEDLRKFSRLDESDIKHIDLIDNIKSTLSIIKPEISKKEVNFIINSPERLMFNCYPGQLNQALVNILINAIQAVENKGKVELKVVYDSEKLILKISDNGSGIPEKHKDKIFNPFFTTKPVGSGTGLGLSITYKIITDIHKGNIKVESEIGKGSIFTIEIPNIIEK